MMTGLYPEVATLGDALLLRHSSCRADTMGMPAAAPDYYTREMVLAIPEDGKRYETVHGELLVTPAPRVIHQVVLQRLWARLCRYLDARPIGLAFGVDADISWGDDSLVQPDLFVAPLEQLRTMDWSKVRDLLLVAELISPSSRRADRFTKRRLYQENGVGLYWVIDIDGGFAEAWRPESVQPELIRDRLTWHPAGVAEPFVMELEELFRPI